MQAGSTPIPCQALPSTRNSRGHPPQLLGLSPTLTRLLLSFFLLVPMTLDCARARNRCPCMWDFRQQTAYSVWGLLTGTPSSKRTKRTSGRAQNRRKHFHVRLCPRLRPTLHSSQLAALTLHCAPPLKQWRRWTSRGPVQVPSCSMHLCTSWTTLLLSLERSSRCNCRQPPCVPTSTFLASPSRSLRGGCFLVDTDNRFYSMSSPLF
jgi:hypothetical protein